MDKLDLILAELREIKQEQKEIKQEQKEFREELLSFAAKQANMEIELERHGELLQQLIQIIGVTNAKLERLDLINAEIAVLKDEVFQNKRDIYLLKMNAKS